MKATETLKKASDLVDGDRAKSHGDARRSFMAVAGMWAAYLGCAVTAVDVPVMMSMLKAGRIKHGEYNEDDFTDGSGYFAIAGEVSDGPEIQPDETPNDILVRTVWGEARGEGIEGMKAIAHVVLNRANSKTDWWGSDIASVCLKRKQFTCWNEDDPNYQQIKDGMFGLQDTAAARLAVAEVLDGDPDMTKGATHYHASDSLPYWAMDDDREAKNPCAEIGRHVFYTEQEIDR